MLKAFLQGCPGPSGCCTFLSPLNQPSFLHLTYKDEERELGKDSAETQQYHAGTLHGPQVTYSLIPVSEQEEANFSIKPSVSSHPYVSFQMLLHMICIRILSKVDTEFMIVSLKELTPPHTHPFRKLCWLRQSAAVTHIRRARHTLPSVASPLLDQSL